MCWGTLKELRRTGTSAPHNMVLGKETSVLGAVQLRFNVPRLLSPAPRWQLAQASLRDATCFMLLCCSFPCDEVATWRIIPRWEGCCLPACVHPWETLERDKAFTSLNDCAIKYCWIYTIVDWAYDFTNPFANKFQSFSRSVTLSAGWQALIWLLVTLCVPNVSHLFISILLVDSCIENLLGTLTVEHENMHQLQKRHHQPTAETPFIWKYIMWLFFVMQCDGWLLWPCLVLCCLTAFMVCSPGLSHSP